MIGRKKIRSIVNMIFDRSRADQVEVIITNYDSSLTRYANNYIHQNVSESNSSLSIRVIFGKKIGSASTSSLDPGMIKKVLGWAETVAHHQLPNNDFDTLPLTKTAEYKKVNTYVPKTVRFSPGDRANAVLEIVNVAKKNALNSYGSVSNGAAEVCVANSLGTFGYNLASDIFCNCVMAGGNSTGYVQYGHRDVDAINFKKLAMAAAQKAVLSKDPIDLPPGRYTTILEPLAASELLDFMAFYAFNGKFYLEGRSCLCGKLGKKIADSKVTIIDDPFTNKGFPSSFDAEGVAKRRLTLIDRGVARNIVHDTITARKAGTGTTGHALPAPNTFGPIASNLIVKPGKKSLDSMIKNTARGVLVTRFHYTNVIDPVRLTFTGMTRDGTFLIERGKITRGIKNLRFTENIVECLDRIEDISSKADLVASDPGYGARSAHGTIIPALKIKDFAFTSATEF
jgi:predicted Zn-dependent protease